MSKLICCRGLPASGKTTWAKTMQEEAPDETLLVSRDDTRMALFGSCGPDYYECDKDTLYRKEKMVTRANQETISAALKQGFVVIVHDTNLRLRNVRELRAIAVRNDAQFVLIDFDTTLEVCLDRNKNRERKVPEGVIRTMYDRFLRKGFPVLTDEPEQGAVEPVVKDDTLPTAIIADVDGTLALHQGRSPYDESLVHTDKPFENVIEVVSRLALPNTEEYSTPQVIVMSARTEGCREATVDWLMENGLVFDEIHMRKVGDMRKDREVKYDLFNAHVRDKYNVLAVFDDRNSVIDLWREMGLTALQCAPGDF